MKVYIKHLKQKEGVTIQDESQTLADITFQNYFRMYKKPAESMTGTAQTEATEFAEIYNRCCINSNKYSLLKE